MSGYIFATKACINVWKKNLISSNISSTCPHNMVNFGPLAAEISFISLGHRCKFQRVSRLGTVTAQHSSSGRQPNFAALNRGCHLYSAGRPSRWALDHISSCPSLSFLWSPDLLTVTYVWLIVQILGLMASLVLFCCLRMDKFIDEDEWTTARH